MSDNKRINAGDGKADSADQTLNASLWLLRMELQEVKGSGDGEDRLRQAMRRSRPAVVAEANSRRWPLAIAAGLLIGLGTLLGAWLMRSPIPAAREFSAVQPAITRDAGIPVYQAIPYPGSPDQLTQMTGNLAVLRVRMPVLAQDPGSGRAQPMWIEADVLVGVDGIARAIRTDNVVKVDHVSSVHVMENYQ